MVFASVMKRQGFYFLLGICAGLCLTRMLNVLTVTSTQIRIVNPESLRSDLSRLDTETHGRHQTYEGNHPTESFPGDPAHELLDRVGNVRQQHFDDKEHHHDDDSLAKSLYQKVRVACWILTSPSNLDKKAIHVKNTWAKRCNLFLFMSSVHNASFPTIGLNVTEGRSHLTAKTMQAFKYLYDNHLNDADWFLKADDDTYVILENLRYFLSDKNSEEPVYFGHRFKPFMKQGYTSGGGGYVLSREALRRFGTKGATNRSLCAEDKGAEDVQMGKCLQNMDVKLKSSRDAMNRTRFHCFYADTMLKGTFPDWYLKYDYERIGFGGGVDSISDYAITFHYVSPAKMYSLEFFTYHLQPYGIIHRPQKLNIKT